MSKTIEAMQSALRAGEKFVNKVQAGLARSTETYRELLVANQSLREAISVEKAKTIAPASKSLEQKWIPCSESLPCTETPVLIFRKGAICLGELRWDHPNFEDNYDAYKYWDDPNDDGKDWAFDSVTHWLSLPNAPVV